MVRVDDFCVDRYEAHLKELQRDGATVPHPYYERPNAGATYVAASEAGVFPQGYVSRIEASAACVAAGKRLCSRSEWLRACRMAIPASRPPRAPTCNVGKVHLLSYLFADRQGSFRYDEHFNAPALNKTPGFLARTGEHDDCQSESGAFDMIGNLHEWVSDTVSATFLQRFESEGVHRQWQPGQVGNGIFMGGFYSTTGEHGPGCAFTTIAHEPAYHDYSTGFRCCSETVPRTKE